MAQHSRSWSLQPLPTKTRVQQKLTDPGGTVQSEQKGQGLLSVGESWQRWGGLSVFLFIASKSQCGLPVQHGNGFLTSSMEHSPNHPNSSTQPPCLPSAGFSFSCSSYSCIADTQLLWMSSPNRFRSATDLSTSSASRAMHSSLGNRENFVFHTAYLLSITSYSIVSQLRAVQI